jgi:hypothetical protein
MTKRRIGGVAPIRSSAAPTQLRVSYPSKETP